ncbi:hypothetical protein [Kitasatospora sp. NA04385]|uniref:hypothetical protein n=1 Tax=Kitasatospora sp. NA04385 TaxID=2742135 RepID=UPI0020CB01FF|nr:hypothetical protein [Kitasatospora sp. NA04385]
MKKQAEEVRRLRAFVLDSAALSLAVRGDRMMIARLDLAARGEAEVVTSAMTLAGAYDARTTEQRWDWVLSRVKVAELGKTRRDRHVGCSRTPACTGTSTRSTPCSRWWRRGNRGG